jgi:hypothetical protein
MKEMWLHHKFVLLIIYSAVQKQSGITNPFSSKNPPNHLEKKKNPEKIEGVFFK